MVNPIVSKTTGRYVGRRRALSLEDILNIATQTAYDNSQSCLAADNVQSAIDELAGGGCGASTLNLPLTTAPTVGTIRWNDNPGLHLFGSQNLFAGVLSGNFTMTGRQNVALGYEAGNALTNGLQNVFVGYQSGHAATSATSNAALGRGSCRSLTTGYGNTMLGHSAGHDLTTGGVNTGVGQGVLYYLTTGSNNVAVGEDAGVRIVDGSGNVFIGRAVGRSLGLTTSTSNRLMIHNADSATPLIDGDFNLRTLKINGSHDATSYKVGGIAGASGTSGGITVVNGIVTAIA